MARDRANLVWVDLETTGLNVARRVILEIATVVTDSDLTIIGEGPLLVIHHTEEELEHLDPWCEKQHGMSGLLDASLASDISLHEAEQQTLMFLRRHTHRGTAPLCGNTIGFDRRFLRRYMRDLHDHLNHRSIDVSSISELAHRWYPGVMAKLDKDVNHRASVDIHASIDELRLYRQLIFRD